MFTQILSALGSVAGIASVIFGIFKYIEWKTRTTPEQTAEKIDQEEAKKEQDFEESGRPQ